MIRDAMNSPPLSGAGLPIAPGTGVIVTGYSGGTPNVVIGEYQVVTTSAPEPSTWALLAGGFVLAGFIRYRRVNSRS